MKVLVSSIVLRNVLHEIGRTVIKPKFMSIDNAKVLFDSKVANGLLGFENGIVCFDWYLWFKVLVFLASIGEQPITLHITEEDVTIKFIVDNGKSGWQNEKVTIKK